MAKKKKRRGRPFLKPKDRRSEVVPVRITPGEHRQLLKDAEEAGMSVSLYLVECWKKARR
ncbi:MAG: plasmid mobilization protein [Planctomycetota bacterium]